jgi:membrane-associated PAP2 superfamily phosphatase
LESGKNFLRKINLWTEVLIKKTRKMADLVINIMDLVVKKAKKERKKVAQGRYKKTPFQLIREFNYS